MEKEGKSNQKAKEPDFVFQWGSSKRHRCPPKVKNKDGDKKRNNGNGSNSTVSRNSDGGGNKGVDGSKLSSESLERRKVTSSSGVNSRKERSPLRSLHR